VRRLIGLPANIPAAKVQSAGEVRREGYTIRKLAFETEPGITVPALHFTTGKASPPRPLVLYVHGYGKAEDAAPGGTLEKLVRAGQDVLALDPRGIGETAPGNLPRNPGYFGVDFTNSFLGLHLNRPLLGQRVHDVLAVIEHLAKAPETAAAPLSIVGSDAAGPIVLHAAALDTRLKHVTLDRSVLSWSSVVRTPISYNQLTNVVPGALRIYDLPELAATVAPRTLIVRAPLDPVRKPVAQAVLEEAYAPCKAAYAARRAQQQLTLRAEP
jgi:pimeloyl-ACP methyl ester carboxylesterase